MFIYWIILLFLLVKIGIFFEENQIKIIKKTNKKFKINKNVLHR